MATDDRNEVTIYRNPGSVARQQAPARPSLFSPFDEMENLFERLMPRLWMRPMGWPWPAFGGVETWPESCRVPQLDMIDRDDEVLIRAELPGVDKEDVEVSVANSTLTIHGSVRRQQVERKQDYFRSEIAGGNFSRSLSIPDGVDTAKIEATLHDGILEISLPKKADAQRRAVTIK